MATTWIALLRGINVGKAKRLAMADLRAMLEALGYESPVTLANSGNAVFEAPGTEAAIARAVARGVDELGMDVKVLVRSAAQLAKVVGAFPFADRPIEPGKLLVGFASAKIRAAELRSLDRTALLPDEFEVGDRVIYTCHPNGIAGSRLPSFERLLGIDITARNWGVVQKLHALAGGRA